MGECEGRRSENPELKTQNSEQSLARKSRANNEIPFRAPGNIVVIQDGQIPDQSA